MQFDITNVSLRIHVKDKYGLLFFEAASKHRFFAKRKSLSGQLVHVNQ
jgi:hypothetical protein